MVLIWWKYEIQKPKNTDEIYWLQGAPRRIRKAEDKINKIPTKKYWEKLEKFADKLNKKGVDEVLFGDIE